MKRGQDLRGNPSTLAGRNVGPRYGDGKLCVWCSTAVFKSQRPKPRGRGKWAHGDGCTAEPKRFELERWVQKRLAEEDSDATNNRVREEIDAWRTERDALLLTYLAHAMRDAADEGEHKQLLLSLPDYDPTPMVLRAMTLAGDTETVRWLREERYFDHFDVSEDDN